MYGFLTDFKARWNLRFWSDNAHIICCIRFMEGPPRTMGDQTDPNLDGRGA